jgi:serine/threonine protein kinase
MQPAKVATMDEVALRIDDELLDLVEAWEDAVRAGRSVSVTQLTRGCPHRQADLDEAIRRLRRTAWLADAMEPSSRSDSRRSSETSGLDHDSTARGPHAIRGAVHRRTPPGSPDANERSGPPSAQVDFDSSCRSGVAEGVSNLDAALAATVPGAMAPASTLAGATAAVEPIPGYRLEELLGRGGSGSVYAGRAPGGVPVAIKLIDMAEPLAAAERRSLDLMREVSHPAILPIHTVHLTDRHLVIVMERAQGTLRDRLSQVRATGEAGLSAAELGPAFLRLAEALDALNHEWGIQHRDVKPANMLMVAGAVKLGDFGLAAAQVRTRAGHSGAMTAAFAPPEFFAGRTHRHSDQYSLAVSWCVLRTGESPFGSNDAESMAKKLRERFDLSRLPDLERPALARALSSHPDRRWPTSREFVEALADPALVKRANRRRWLARTLTLAGVAGLAGGAVALARTPRARHLRTFTDGDGESIEPIRSIAVDGQRPVLWTNGSALREWNHATGAFVRKLPTPGGPMVFRTRGVFVPRLATTDDRGGVRLWDAERGELLREFRGLSDCVNAIAVPDQPLKLAAAGCERVIRVWDARDGKPIAGLSGHQQLVSGLAFHPTGRRLFSASWDGTIRVWDVDAAREIHRFDFPEQRALSLALSDDGRVLAVRLTALAVVIDTVRGVELVRVPCGSRQPGLAIAGDGDRFVTALDAETAAVLSTSTGAEQARIRRIETNDFESLAFDGHHGFVFAGHKGLQQWRLEG